MSSPRIHSTPPEAFGHRVRDAVTVSGRTFQFDRPAGLDHLFDHPAVRSAYASDEYIPYWADLWPAAVMLAEVVLAEPWGENLQALEFGCGLGISGMAALSRGLHVTFSDVDEAAVQLAASNARLNGFRDFETAAIDLRAVPEQTFPVLLAADVCYELRLTEAVAKFVKLALAPGGLALLTDTDRYSARPLRWLLEQEGLVVQIIPMKAGPPGNVQKGYLYRITHRA
jgi:2-polyprenyl-3-methyl-5-hydroxy-6-metoxy-1,4-benzoquinol methylase